MLLQRVIKPESLKYLPGVLILFFVFTVVFNAAAQEVQAKPNDKTYPAGDQSPEFPGGQSVFNQFWEHNMRYPAKARDQHIQGRVFIAFVIEKDGSVTNAGVIRGIGGGCNEEAVRVIKLSPK